MIISEETKTYKIELTVEELEFIRRSLNGIHELLTYLHNDMRGSFNLSQYQSKILINPQELSEKIFIQYHDEDGVLL